MKKQLLVILMLLFSISAMAQSTLTIADVNGVSGTNVTVPVTVTNFDNVGSITLKINYDQTVVSFVELQNNVLESQGTLLTPSASNGTLTVSWFSLSALGISSGKLFDIVFNYVGGETDLAVNNSSEFSTALGSPVTVTYTNGSVQGGGVPDLGVPTLESPSNNSTGVGLTPVLNWSDVTDATKYDLQVSTSEGFGTTVIDEADLSASSYTVASDVFDNSTKYYWKARAKNDTQSGAWSATFNFTTESGVVTTDIVISLDDITVSPNSEAVMPINVENFSSIGSFTFKINYDDTKVTFTSISGAPSGTLANGTDGVLAIAWFDLSGTNPLTVADGKLMDIHFDYVSGEVPLTFTDESELTNGDGQVLVVSYVDGNILEGQALPDVPELSTPADNASDVSLTPDLIWLAATDAESYDLQIATDEAFSSIIVNETGLTALQYSVAEGALGNDTTYYWRVRAVNSAGSSEYSTPFSFTTLLPDLEAPTLASPQDSATDVELLPLFTWSNVDGATSFTLQVSTASDFSALVLDESGITIEEFEMTTNALQELTTYYWRVNATDGSRVSDWSTVFSFTTLTTTLEVPVLVSPANDANDVDLSGTELVWNSVGDATNYSVEVATDDAFSNVVASQTDSPDTSFVIGDDILQYETTYYWRVKATAEGKASEWSSPNNFLTVLPPLVAPELTSPADGSENLLLLVNFEWDSAVNATSYGLQVATENTFGSLVVDETGLTETTFSVEESTLEGMTTYFWRVKSEDGDRSSDWSAVWSFTTEDPSDVEDYKAGIPEEFSLFQNYPNPFNPSTKIRYNLPEASHVKIVIVDLLGREVAELYNSFQSAGYFELNWDASNMSSGNYIYKIDVKTETGKMYSDMKKMQFLK